MNMRLYEVIAKLEYYRKKIVFAKWFVRLLPIVCILVIVAVDYRLLIFAPWGLFALAAVEWAVYEILAGESQRQYKKLYKKEFVEACFNEIYENVQFRYKGGFTKGEVMKMGLMPIYDEYEGEDYLKAKYKDVTFEQAEMVISEVSVNSEGERSKRTVFSGMIITFHMTPRGARGVHVMTKNFYPAPYGIGDKLQSAEVESIDFNEKFDIYASNAHDVFYVLTPQMITKIQKMNEKKNNFHIHFYYDKVYLAVEDKRNYFEMNLNKPISYQEEMEKIREQTALITDFIDGIITYK